MISLWSKSSDSATPSKYHDLLAHMIDVACVAENILTYCVPCAKIEKLRIELGTSSIPSTIHLLAFLAGCHDLGKATPGFQAKIPDQKSRLKYAGLDFSAVKYCSSTDRRHDVATAALLPDALIGLWPNWCSKKKWLNEIATVVGGHHGVFPDDKSIIQESAYCGGGYWVTLRQELLTSLTEVLSIPTLFPPSMRPVKPSPGLCMFLAGLTSVADWIGSNEKWFPYIWPVKDAACYCMKARQRSKNAVDNIGWQRLIPSDEPLTTASFFPEAADWRPVQKAAIDLMKRLTQPSLVIIESETGSGKTEAAWIIADALMKQRMVNGLYVAMPTQATSNKMHDRLKDYLTLRFGGELSDVQLVHSGSALYRWEHLKLNNREADESADTSVSSWFTPKKRSLLASFGVGTIDQSLLAAMLTRHNFVRLFGMSGKAVIFDEVHAYDLYMFTLFERLLEWLAEAGIPVLILSATLPEASRQALLGAYSGKESFDSKQLQSPYPRITWVGSEDGPSSNAIQPSPSYEISIQLITDDSQHLVKELRARIEQGGCVAVICNTVKRAQKLYQDWNLQQDHSDVEAILFHSRFQSGRRQEIEKQVCERFGKPGSSVHRPTKALVIATQVIEQSLDLDFDFMVTDLAPVDLLIQRAGRLWRHDRTQSQRGGFKVPELWIRVPSEGDGSLPDFDMMGRIYHSSLLLKTWVAIRDRSTIAVPDDIPLMIEEVYGGDTANGLNDLEVKQLTEMLDKEQKNHAKVTQNANSRLMASPTDDMAFLKQFQPGLSDDDDPGLHKDLRALTRLGDPSVSLIVLHRYENKLSLTSDNTRTVDLNSTPDVKTALALAHCAINVPCPAWNVNLLNTLIALPQPDSWKKHPLLRSYRLLEMQDGRCDDLEEVVLILDPELGLIIEYKKTK